MTLLRNGTALNGTILLAHGAGAPADSPFMEAFAEGLAKRGYEVLRFNFPYMEKRQEDGKKRPPDRAPKLVEAFRQTIEEIRPDGPLLIGGKSMGGRIASMVAAEDNSICNGLVCLGYPFHPPGKPEKLRTDHFPKINLPTLILQGERDAFGGKALLDTLQLPESFSLHWAPDGNHDLTPRKASGQTAEGNWNGAMDKIVATFS
ncbi:MAG: alpha/beta fold hydrolase [Alphaproteobacteria bacterium]|nr:alpha/beta fold hydrolase [Alphaproteobacteria bacterium]